MNRRLSTAKPSVALWTFITLGDLALLVGHVGVAVLIAFVGVVAAAVVGVRLALLRVSPSRRAGRGPYNPPPWELRWRSR